MRRLSEILARPIPAEWSLALFAAIAVILLVTAAVLMAIPGPTIDTPTTEQVVTEAPADPNPTFQLENTVEDTARRFMDDYLSLTSGHGDPSELRAASPKLIHRLDRPMRIPPAARHRHPRLVDVQVSPIKAGQATVTATVETGELVFPVILHLGLIEGRWLVTRVGAE